MNKSSTKEPIKMSQARKIYKKLNEKMLIGWSEWCGLPELNLPVIKAKIDTGAKTSALHAYDIKKITIKNKLYVNFKIHPLQRNNELIRECQAEVVDERHIMSSNGHIEHRCVIQTLLQLGDKAWDIQITLSNRDPLAFRMLLGREALNGRVLIDPVSKCQQGKINKKMALSFYL